MADGGRKDMADVGTNTCRISDCGFRMEHGFDGLNGFERIFMNR